MALHLLIQQYEDGTNFKNYVPCALAGAKKIAGMLTGLVSIWKMKSSSKNSIGKTRLLTLRLTDGPNNYWITGRVSSSETKETIRNKIFPITIDGNKFGDTPDSNISLTQLKN